MATADDANGSGDGSGSGSDDGGSGLTDCLERWRSGPLQLSAPEELTRLSSDGDERDPWISADGLTLYFSRDPGTQGMTDIYRTTRLLVTQAFDNPSAVVNLDRSESHEYRVSLAMDDTMLVLSSDRPPAPPPSPPDAKIRIFISIRPNTTVDFGSPDERHLTTVNAEAFHHYDPFLTRNGLKLYLAPNSGPSGRQQIKVATRLDINSDFGAPIPVLGLPGQGNDSNADPALSLDERILVFSNGGDLHYATRANPGDAFSKVMPIPAVNDSASEADPMLSANGCDLYFASTRRGGKFHLFHASVAK